MIPTDLDFFDFGCSDGANIHYIQRLDPAMRGLGIDIDQKKVDKATAKGFRAINFDILKLPRQKQVSFVTMSHFLEHLPSVKMAEVMIERGIDVAREFVFIRQPWFDSDGALLLQDLKFYWSDWRGHPNKMTSLDFYLCLKRALAEGTICGFGIYGRTPVSSSTDSSLIPVSAPVDQHRYDSDLHGDKKLGLPLATTAFKEIVVICSITPDARIAPFISPLGKLVLLQGAGSSLNL